MGVALSTWGSAGLGVGSDPMVSPVPPPNLSTTALPLEARSARMTRTRWPRSQLPASLYLLLLPWGHSGRSFLHLFPLHLVPHDHPISSQDIRHQVTPNHQVTPSLPLASSNAIGGLH